MDKVRTGDVLLFKCNGMGANVIHIFASSKWNHAGIAIRMTPDRKVVYDGGELFILEMSANKAIDRITGDMIKGCIISSLEDVRSRYNRIEARHVNKRYQVDSCLPRITKFINDNHRYKFPKDFLPFVGVWLGLPIIGQRNSTKTMFCSELVTHFYDECFGPAITEVDDITYHSGELSLLFGEDESDLHTLYSPQTYDKTNLTKARIFAKDTVQSVIYLRYDNIWNVFTNPIIFMLVFVLIVWFILPKE